MAAAEGESHQVVAMSRRDIVDDEKLHEMMSEIPGAKVSEIKEK